MWRRQHPPLFCWQTMKPDCTCKQLPAMFGLQLDKHPLCEPTQDMPRPISHGTLNLRTGQEFAMRSNVINAEVSAQHLEMILEANPDVPIILLWDRTPWHRGKPIDQLLEENPRLEIIFFPPAGPDINPQKHVWKSVRTLVSHHQLAKRYFPKYSFHLIDFVCPLSLVLSICLCKCSFSLE